MTKIKTGLYFQDPEYQVGRNITDPSLVLNLPLYDLDGAAFMSKDAYGHLCTNFGSVWTLHGRSLDGVDDFIQTPASPAFNFGTGDFTMEAWARPDVLVGDHRALITLSTPRRHLDLTLDNGGLSAAIYLEIAEVVQLSPPLSWVIGQWYHIAINRLAGVTRIFRDGIVVSSATNQAAAVSAGPGFYIGRFPTPSLHPWNGLIGEVHIYNRALTPQENQRNYLATKWRY
jgi:hypothetical protein